MATKDLGRVIGKSAYEFACDGGYSGTEADFAEIMAYDAKTAVSKISKQITDPDNYPLQEVESEHTIIELESGRLSRENGSERDGVEGLRTPDFIPVSGGEKICPVYEELSSEKLFCFLLYDSSYNYISTNWFNNEANHAYVGTGEHFTIPDNIGATYLKGYISAEVTNGTLTLKNKVEPLIIKAEHKKIYVAEHGYSIYGSTIDDETMHKFVIKADGKDGNTYNITEIKAPTSNPQEATIALMNWGNGIKQFVDFSSMVYDEENPSVEIVNQTRGGKKLPTFSIRFNDGQGSGRVKKFVVHPDAIPIELTNGGIRVRKNNDYNNSGTDEEFVTVNLADLYEKVNTIYEALVANGTIK